jgi:hypothetical protein
MSRDNSQNLQAAMQQARTALIAATADIVSMPEGEERSSQLRALATILVGSHEELRAQAIRLCPDLERAAPIPDAQLHESELVAVSRLKDSDIGIIDRALVASSTSSWKKATRVIGDTLVTLNSQFPDVSRGFYAQRVAALVRSGGLQAQGNLEFMRLCEVKLSLSDASAA